MVRFINRFTGGIIWVTEDRAEEYKAAGHRPAADTAPEKPVQEKPPRRTAKRTKK